MTSGSGSPRSVTLPPVGQAGSRPEFDDFLLWLTLERRRAPGTVEAYRRDLRRYGAFLGRRPLGEVTPALLSSYAVELQASGLAPATVARSLVAARALHRFLAIERGAPDPGQLVETPSVPSSLPKALDEDAVIALIESVGFDSPVDRRDRLILEILYGCGIRVSELVGLDLADVDLDGRLMRVLGKGSKERVVPLGRPTVDAFAQWLDPGGRPNLGSSRAGSRSDLDALILNQRGGRLSRQGVWMVLQRRARPLGLSTQMHPHVLRHSCATHMLDHGADLRAVQELLGHASISTTQIYTKVATSRLFAAFEAAHPRARRSVGA